MNQYKISYCGTSWLKFDPTIPGNYSVVSKRAEATVFYTRYSAVQALSAYTSFLEGFGGEVMKSAFEIVTEGLRVEARELSDYTYRGDGREDK